MKLSTLRGEPSQSSLDLLNVNRISYVRDQMKIYLEMKKILETTEDQTTIFALAQCLVEIRKRLLGVYIAVLTIVKYLRMQDTYSSLESIQQDCLEGQANWSMLTPKNFIRYVKDTYMNSCKKLRDRSDFDDENVLFMDAHPMLHFLNYGLHDTVKVSEYFTDCGSLVKSVVGFNMRQ